MSNALTPRQVAIRALAVGSMRAGIMVEFTAPDGPLYTSAPIAGSPGCIYPTVSPDLALWYYEKYPQTYREWEDMPEADLPSITQVGSEKFEAVPVSIYGRTAFRYK